MSGSTIVMAFQAFTRDTSARGFNYSEVFYTYSTNSGATWSTPRNITNTPSLDERYPSISKWNASGELNIVYQEDPSPGLAAFPGDGSDTARTRQVFCRVSNFTLGVYEHTPRPQHFVLEQNYPNPFNPSTTIRFQVPTSAYVTLRIFNVLGQEVATLVSGQRNAGTYQVLWDGRTSSGATVASGVYFYSLVAKSAGDKTTYTNIKRMLLLK
jgi:hypothetical protein